MRKVNVNVRGIPRKIYIEKHISKGTWQARTYVGSKVVSGTLSKNSLGVYTFAPAGVHAQLV